jgi:hypothetical protein
MHDGAQKEKNKQFLKRRFFWAITHNLYIYVAIAHDQFDLQKLLLSPTTITCPNTDVSWHILVKRYIHIRTGNSGRGEYKHIN